MRSFKFAVFDSFALMVLLFREQGYREVRRLLQTATRDGVKHLMCSVNWAELRYSVERRAGPDEWPKRWTEILSLPIEVVPADQDLAECAGRLKARGGLSLADCFAVALAQREGCAVLTGDPEFKRVETQVAVRWL